MYRLIVSLALIATCYFLFKDIHVLINRIDVKNNGITQSGIVVDKKEENAQLLFIKIKDVDENSVYTKVDVSREIWENKGIGDTLSIKDILEKPDFAIAENGDIGAWKLLFRFILLLLTFIGLVFSFAIIWSESINDLLKL